MFRPLKRLLLYTAWGCLLLASFFLLFIVLPSPATSSCKRKIAILTRENYLGEHAFAIRIESACHNLGWQADVFEIDSFKKLKKHPYDFVINLVPGACKFRNSKYYIAIFDPIHHYFDSEGALLKAYRDYDGYLLNYTPTQEEKNFTKGKLPYIQWHPTAQKRDYQEAEPLALFYLACIWGNRFEETKMRQCLNLLDKESFTRVYGADLIKKYCPQTYCSTLPFDRDSVCKAANEAGVTLVIHSHTNNAYGLPSGRIFEAAAASSIIICDENPFVRKHFGDSVLYINTDESALSIQNQIKKHMDWIQSNKIAAKEKARKAYCINNHFFSLEKQLVHLGIFHDERSKNRFQKCKSQITSWIKEIFSLTKLAATLPIVDSTPLTSLPNVEPYYSLLNSVDFHPGRNLACVTYTHNNKIVLYEIDEKKRLRPFQTLCNPLAKLSDPQHAVFSPNGDKIVVANWTNQTFTIYSRQLNQFYSPTPTVTIEATSLVQPFKPHGIAFSPCGKYLAVAYGAGNNFPKAIALFKSEKDTLECTSLLNESSFSGTPKGMTFSPDGTHIFVSFCEPSSLAIFSIHDEKIDPTPVQTIQEADALLSRPEDVKISPDGSYCAVSNSDKNQITFYHLDPLKNSISEITPFHILKNPQAKLNFPHGIAFSSDGAYLAITQFGNIKISIREDIEWEGNLTPATEGLIHLYRMNNRR